MRITAGGCAVADSQFSLLMAVYAGDTSEFFERAFKSSVQDQTLKPSEVIVVQDGPVSTELAATLRTIKSASPVPTSVIELPANGGLAAALERGLAACQFDIVARMDADDISLPHRFSNQLKAIDAGLDLVGAGMLEFADEDGVVLGRRVPPTGHEHIAHYARFHDPFNHPTVVYRRSAVRKAGGYQDVGRMEDYWLFARMIQAGVRVDNLQEPLLMYRVGAGAYARRGGWSQLRAEVGLQREFRRVGFTTRRQWLRNVLVRGGYRLVPVALRRVAYRRFFTREGSHDL